MAQNKSTGRREMIGKTVSTQKEAMDNVKRSEVLQTELLPGIVNDVALEVIAPKLYFEDLRRLQDHPVWKQAIRGHLVYKARVRSRATENLQLVFLSKYPEYIRPDLNRRREGTLYVYYSSRFVYKWYELGPVPSHRAGLLLHCQCESWNFAIYVMGGTKDVLDESGSTEIYVMDLAGLRTNWKQCASMQQARLNSAVGVIHGKIFAFGGISGGSYIRGCEVYDPKVDAWSKIEPMISLGRDLKVSRVGEELFVYGLYVVVDDNNDAEDRVNPLDRDNDSEDEVIDPDEFTNEYYVKKYYVEKEYLVHFDVDFVNVLCEYDGYVTKKKDEILVDMRHADFVEAYDPVKNKWRAVEIGEALFYDDITAEPLDFRTASWKSAEVCHINL